MQRYSNTATIKDTRQSTESQETNVIVATATRIYKVGAVYRSVEPDVYEVTPDSGEATLMSVDQFRATLSLVHAMKSTATLPVY